MMPFWYRYRLHWLMCIWWRFASRFDCYREKPNPWRHAGRRGKKAGPLLQFRRCASQREFRRRRLAGWKPSYPWLLDRLFRIVP